MRPQLNGGTLGDRTVEHSVKTSMLEYYDVHANDYDRVYSGEFSGSELVGSDAYPEDTAALQEVIQRSCSGTLLDVPCGTAFWLPAYSSSVERAVLIDQSDRMIAKARSRATTLGVDSRCTFIEGDVLSHPWQPDSFDTMLVGFFLSHTDHTDEEAFFGQIRRGLKRGGSVVILDSIWNAQRALSKPKEAVVRRASTDGRRFDVYKRYFDASDIIQTTRRHGFRATVLHTGRAFIAATATLID
jgi:ubiquinone/menaquinone biosynthesis C-methylase UbiE